MKCTHHHVLRIFTRTSFLTATSHTIFRTIVHTSEATSFLSDSGTGDWNLALEFQVSTSGWLQVHSTGPLVSTHTKPSPCSSGQLLVLIKPHRIKAQPMEFSMFSLKRPRSLRSHCKPLKPLTLSLSSATNTASPSSPSIRVQTVRLKLRLRPPHSSTASFSFEGRSVGDVGRQTTTTTTTTRRRTIVPEVLGLLCSSSFWAEIQQHRPRHQKNAASFLLDQTPQQFQKHSMRYKYQSHPSASHGCSHSQRHPMGPGRSLSLWEGPSNGSLWSTARHRNHHLGGTSLMNSCLPGFCFIGATDPILTPPKSVLQSMPPC